ncbi:YitT family protein [Candidatus Phytoplasma melaleucae]|uniref:YitT family protein n=1 Tax=Candidatus Phytoplasma melaleucae TaxID=2982630 RepID=A0ABT9DFB1_9MOLU|nr:YitT family protein ['Melaleuca sp.' phytoplasma]MDO8168039.1 YitT family protein ['Melaleuca sp.' phytoplasma]
MKNFFKISIIVSIFLIFIFSLMICFYPLLSPLLYFYTNDVKLHFKLIKIFLGSLLLIFSIYFFILPEEFIIGGLESSLLFLDKIFFYDKKTKQQNYFFSTNHNIIIARILIILLFGFFLKDTLFFFISTLLLNFVFAFIIKNLDYFHIDRNFFLNILPDFIKKNSFLRLFFSSLIIGLCVGIGCGLIFSSSSSTGGTDVIFLYLEQRLNIDLKRILILTDGLMILISFFIDFFRKIDKKMNIINKYFFSIITFLIAINLIAKLL